MISSIETLKKTLPAEWFNYLENHFKTADCSASIDFDTKDVRQVVWSPEGCRLHPDVPNFDSVDCR